MIVTTFLDCALDVFQGQVLQNDSPSIFALFMLNAKCRMNPIAILVKEFFFMNCESFELL